MPGGHGAGGVVDAEEGAHKLQLRLCSPQRLRLPHQFPPLRAPPKEW